MTQIVPAILATNVTDFEKQVRQIEKYTDIIHVDICDGIFAPQKTITVDDIRNVKTTAQLALHFMVQDPTQEIEKWYDFPNIKRMIFHFETAGIPAAVIHHIESYGFNAGVAVNPETPAEDVNAVGFQADMVVFMAVNPGRQGQEFFPEVIEKINEFKAIHPNTPIAIDGGVHVDELIELKDLNLDYIIVGSEIFMHPNPGERLKELQKMIS